MSMPDDFGEVVPLVLFPVWQTHYDVKGTPQLHVRLWLSVPPGNYVIL